MPNPMYSSDESGTIGFGPWSQENGNIEYTHVRSLMQQAVNNQVFSNNTVSYNITFKGEHSHIRDKHESYIQLDSINSVVANQA